MSDTEPKRSLRAIRIALILVVVVIVATAYQLGLFQRFANPAEMKRTLVQLGPWGYVAFVGAYTLLQPFGMPGTVFVWAAPLIWPWHIAFTLSMVGTMSASVVGFSFARFIARDWVASRIPEKFKKYDEALGRRAFATVALLRFVFWMPPPLHAFFGVSKVRFWTHFWGSVAGYFVPLFLVSYFGRELLDRLMQAPVSVWIGVGCVTVVIAVGAWLRRRRVQRATD